MRRVLLITGSAGDAQGWGDEGVTESVRQAIEAGGRVATTVFVRTMDELLAALERRSFDIVWSALYHVSDRADTIGMSEDEGAWVADLLQARGIPYIGPSAATMRTLLNKARTHEVLESHGVAVPAHFQVDAGDPAPPVPYPAFVKPCFESRSVGIDEESVVRTPAELQRRVEWVRARLEQPAVVEEFLPGDEYTVLMVGNGSRREFLAGQIYLADPSKGSPHGILRADMRGVGLTKIRKAEGNRAAEAVDLCRQACDVLGCLDHVRTDMRVDAAGRLKIMEVNGIPGLKPIKSWSPQIYTLFHPAANGAAEEYRRLIDQIVGSALERFGR